MELSGSVIRRCAEKKSQIMELAIYAPICIFPLIKYSHNLYVIPGEDTT